ncbi:MAG: sugar O-acetyltransferase [Erysipelotrichaceae bacterium]|nr:sugar O-acetyltransferase [Erysipelotrichaceae bacterium]
MSLLEDVRKGMPYKPSEEELKAIRQKSKRLVYEYNHLSPDEGERKEEILHELLGKVGKDPNIHQNFFCDYGINIEIGDDFFSNYNLVILDPAKVVIGDRVKFGPNVGIYTAGHPVHPDTRATGYEYGLPVTIEDDVWIGGSVTINPGVRIGKGSVIGSGSVVTKDIPEMVIAYGNPCKVIRKITEEDKGLFYQGKRFDI